MSIHGPIIIVEDDEDDIFLIHTALDELQILNPVHVFRNGLDALSFIQGRPEPPLVVISDLNMPVMNGFELLNALLQNGFFTGKIPPFVFLTTSETSMIPAHSFDKQRFSFFTKGYSYDKILETITHIIDHARAVRSE